MIPKIEYSTNTNFKTLTRNSEILIYHWTALNIYQFYHATKETADILKLKNPFLIAGFKVKELKPLKAG